MRTDVKIGLVCALVIVMGAVVFFIAHPGSPNKTTKTDKGANSSTSGTGAADAGTTTAPSASGSTASAGGTGAMGGIMVLPPGTTGATGTTTAPASDIGTPSMGGTASSGATGTGLAGTAGATGTAGYAASPSSGFGPTPSTGTTGTTGSAASSGTHSTIEFGNSRNDSFPAPSTPGFGNSGFGPSPSASTGTTYTIQKGDMLGTVAKQFNVSVKAIEAANPGVDPTRLKVGKAINIPAASATASAGGSATPATPAAHASASGSTASAAGSSAAVSTSAKPGSTYKTKKGDTLVNIARNAYGNDKSWQRIYQANKSSISNPDLVPVGLVIKIPQ